MDLTMDSPMSLAIDLSINHTIDPSIYYEFREHFKMPIPMLRILVKSLLEKDTVLTHVDIAKKLKKDKVIVSGYLDAMVDYGDICVKKLGNSKAYFLNKQGK
jgi:hypothetical protein